MLRRSSRLTTGQFEEAVTKGRVFHSPFFLMRALPSGGADASKVAAVAPVKVAKTAVLRNRTRRRVYAAVRPVVIDTLKPGWHIILIAKPALLGQTTAEIARDIAALFVKAGLVR